MEKLLTGLLILHLMRVPENLNSQIFHFLYHFRHQKVTRPLLEISAEATASSTSLIFRSHFVEYKKQNKQKFHFCHLHSTNLKLVHSTEQATTLC